MTRYILLQLEREDAPSICPVDFDGPRETWKHAIRQIMDTLRDVGCSTDGLLGFFTSRGEAERYLPDFAREVQEIRERWTRENNASAAGESSGE